MKEIPPVSADHLIAAYEKAAHDRARYGWSAMTVSVVSALSSELAPVDILHVLHRLYALNNYLEAASFFGPDEFKRSLTELAGAEFDLSQDALLRAVARAPLFHLQPVKDVTFNKNSFLETILEEARAVPLAPAIPDAPEIVDAPAIADAGAPAPVRA